MNTRTILQFAIGPIGAALLGIITLPLIAWFFSQDDVGRIAMLQVTISFTVLLFSLGLDQAYVREFHEVNDRPRLLKTTCLPGLLILILTLLSTLTIEDRISNWLFDVSDFKLSLLIVVCLLASYQSRFFSLVLRMNNRGLAYSVSQVLPKLFLLFILGLYVIFDFQKNLLNLTLATSVSIVAVCVIFGWNTRKELIAALKSDFNLKQFLVLLKFGAPLIFGGIAFWGLTTVDKIFLRVLSDFSELGLYSVSVSFAAAAIIIQSIFSTVWAPTVYKWASEGVGLEHIDRVTRYILCLVVMLFFLVGLFSWLVTLILPQEYSEVRWIVVACFGFPLLYTLSETTVVGIGITRKSSFSMIASILAFLVNLVGNWILIPRFGAAGAAISTCVAFWFFLVLRTELSIYLWRPIPRKGLYLFTSACVSGASAQTLFGTIQNYWLFSIYWILMFGVWSVYFNKEIKISFYFIISNLKKLKRTA